MSNAAPDAGKSRQLITKLGVCVTSAFLTVLTALPAMGQPGSTYITPLGPSELPLEVELEVTPAGSLKGVPLWKELAELLEHPEAYTCSDPANPETCTSTIERRPGFGNTMPPLNVWPPTFNFLTAQPMRVRTSDGEVSLDQPGPLFDPDQVVAIDDFNTPIEERRIIGELVACPAVPLVDGFTPLIRAQRNGVKMSLCNGKPAGSLVVSNPAGFPRTWLGYTVGPADTRLPPHGTIVATLPGADAFDDLETPINEIDFLREETDTAGVHAALVEYVGRPAAEVLGKAYFWDMQVGSDGVQSCGSCHFHAGADNRTRNQVNPNTLGSIPNPTLDVVGPNEDLEADDFPFRKLADPDSPSEVPVFDGNGNITGVTTPNLMSDADDVVSSMGVSRFKNFVDIPPIGTFLADADGDGVRALPPDIGNAATDPVPSMQGLRRVEPRNTPTFHGVAFNLDNFWDGRARFVFNGGSVFGASDPQTHVFWHDDLEGLVGATNGHIREEEGAEEEEEDEADIAHLPVRIKFSSVASQVVGPPLSEFEMSFLGRNLPKIGKKLLQADVTPLANQRVAKDDSVLGPFSNQGGDACLALGRPTADDKPGLCVEYPELIELAFRDELWENGDTHLNGAPDPTDPFDGYSLTIAAGAADATDTNQFTQMEANFSLFFGLSIQTYVQLTIPDDSGLDRFFDFNPNAGNGVGEPGDQAVLFPSFIAATAGTPGQCPEGSTRNGALCLPPDFGPEEVFGFDMFAGGNLTAALEPGSARNPLRTITTESGDSLTYAVGSNPFTRSAKCMLCHLGPEQTDHSINISHGLLHGGAEFEYPTPSELPDPNTPTVFANGLLPAPEPSGTFRIPTGLILSEEVSEGPAQDAVEVEPRDFATFDNPATTWDDRVVAQQSYFAFGDQGVYNVGLRPIANDPGRGGDDPWGWTLSLAALTLQNIGGQNFEPCDGPDDSCLMTDFDPTDIEGVGAPGLQGFEETGDGAVFPGTTYTLQSINPGYERSPKHPQMPDYMAPWMHDLSAGEAHPQIDEMAGMVPNTTSAPNAGPGIEYPEVLFGADLHCANYSPAQFGSGPPNFGWGPTTGNFLTSGCPNSSSGVTGNFSYPAQGTWPVPNRVLREGAFKAPALRNVELTGPYFHTGSYLTLRQVVDFYFRGGDFPVSNRNSRDPHIVDLTRQAFAFGRTTGTDLTTPIGPDDVPADGHLDYLIGGWFADGLPDPAFAYDEYPDFDHAISPELDGSWTHEAAVGDVKNALVKFLIALTDPRVKYERAPFDRPEIFVPIDGAAPENDGGREGLVNLSGVPCDAGSTGVCFRHLPAVGAGGNVDPAPNFLGISSTPVAGPNNDHFDP